MDQTDDRLGAIPHLQDDFRDPPLDCEVRGGVEIAAARRSEVETRAEGASCPPQQHHTGVGIAGQAVEVLV